MNPKTYILQTCRYANSKTVIKSVSQSTQQALLVTKLQPRCVITAFVLYFTQLSAERNFIRTKKI